MNDSAPLLEVRDLAKRFGSVVALRSATLTICRGEIHALMGANGAGKSTLVKILTGIYPADGGTITVDCAVRTFRSPAEARRAGIVSVYQDPALVPDLTVGQNMRLADVALASVRDHLNDLGIADLNFGELVRDIPYPVLRLIDLARALASDPAVLMLDEITAALPADLSERVFAVVRRWRERGNSVIFISHRIAEVAALCDRATVLRDGVSVGVTDAARGNEDRIVSLMLGVEAVKAGPAEPAPGRTNRGAKEPAALEIRDLCYGHMLKNVSFSLRAGEILGVAALEGQGQQELFDCIAGVSRHDGGEIVAHGRKLKLSHPGDAIAAGLVLIPANRLQALLPQRSIRENVALPLVRNPSNWGLIRAASERHRVGGAVKRLQIDARAGSELRRLSGGNQQKVGIARWIAAGFQTLLCFDPTRGIDIGTKHQIYRLLREMADAGSSVLLFTSELPEIGLVCDRAIVLFGGEIVAEMPASAADEGALLRAAHGMGVAQGAGAPRRGTGTTAAPADNRSPDVQGPTRGFIDKIRRAAAGNPALFGMPALLIVSLAATVVIHPAFDSFDAQSVAMAALPLACAAAAQAVVVISGGIDLSIGSVMAVANVLAASTMKDASFGEALLLAVAILIAGAAIGAANGLLVLVSRVPDVIVTLTTGFIWGGVALLILEKPGGGAPPEFLNLGTGTFITDWLSNSLVLLVVSLAAVWIPVRRSKTGLRIYATGSDRIAAFRSGVNVELARLLAYVLGGLFSAIGGVGLTMTTGIGSPHAGVLYTLSGLAAVVIGGVSLTGGRGGITGPVIAAFVLTLIPADLIFLNIDPNFGQVIQGTLIVLVVMAGGLITSLRDRK
ncbi:MAG: ATP-binding cassette domain-containing protein [Hyphomicrobiales bacterium]|nr:ATP-binding cassette domain-containing protein [Hyphomicrobiales bacterium]